MNVPYRLALVLLLVFARIGNVAAQALFQVTTGEKISNSEIIVEGKVVSKRSYWNTTHSMIFTANTVEVYKIFKGSLQKNTIEVITTGGAVNNYAIIASDLLTLDRNDVGMFFCKKKVAKALLTNADSYDVYSSAQGFVKYDLTSKTAAAPFAVYNDIEKDLYKEIQTRTGRAPVITNSAFSVDHSGRKLAGKDAMNATLAPAITSFSPATVTGGTLEDPSNNVLTINGSGFENNPDPSTSAVEFAHADKQAGNFFEVPSDSNLIVSWTDNQIKIRVPTAAGTGTFRVRNKAGVTASSPTPLTVFYTVLSTWTGTVAKQFNLVNENGTGGYTIKYSNNTANNGLDITKSTAYSTVQRALNTWKDLTGVNIVEAGSTATQKVETSDGENIVVFDNSASELGGPLPNGVLATCYSGLGYCGDETKPFFKTGFDIIIRNAGYSTGDINFTFGPCSPYTSAVQQVDLETVLLHEMGHALNLGHVIALPEGSGAGKVNPAKLMNFSINYNYRRISPDYSAMAGAAFTIASHANNYGTCVPTPQDMTQLAVKLDDKDKCPSNFPTTATPLLTSVAFDLAHCTSNIFDDPGYNQFLADGTSTSITNTAFYAFRTNDAGGDLSLEISNYATNPAALAACVSASSVDITGVQLSVYQLNSCPGGGNFPAPIASTTFSANGTLTPITGLTGNANYLIVLDGVENTKASFNMIFSGSALPEPDKALTLQAYPNPTSGDHLTVQIFNQKAGKYSLNLYDVAGTLAISRSITIASTSDLETLPVSALANGIYSLVLRDASGKRVKTVSIAVLK